MSTQKKTLILARPNHFLADANDMDTNALSSVTRSELDEYRKAHEGDYDVLRKEDLTTSQEATSAIKANLDLLFGIDSKQSKYFDRQLKGGETLFDSHYREIKAPSELTRKVDRATEQEAIQTTVSIGGVDDTTMAEVSTGIEYLIKNGYAYGTDFSATNAVDVAKSLYLETIYNDPSKVNYEFHADVNLSECTQSCLEGITIENYANKSFEDEQDNTRSLTIELRKGTAISVVGKTNGE